MSIEKVMEEVLYVLGVGGGGVQIFCPIQYVKSQKSPALMKYGFHFSLQSAREQLKNRYMSQVKVELLFYVTSLCWLVGPAFIFAIAPKLKRP